MKNARLFYYGTLIPILFMFGYLYSEYMDQRRVIIKTHERCNRQLQLQSQYFTNLDK